MRGLAVIQAILVGDSRIGTKVHLLFGRIGAWQRLTLEYVIDGESVPSVGVHTLAIRFTGEQGFAAICAK